MTMFIALCCDGPDDGETLTVREIRPFGAHLADMSRHGKGYYALEHGALLACIRRRARWVPHTNAEFTWTVARSRRPIGGPPRGCVNACAPEVGRDLTNKILATFGNRR